MNMPMSALARASVSETTPTIPASVATTTENRFGVSIRFATGRRPRRPGSRASPPGNPHQSEHAVPHRGRVATVEGEGDGDDGVVLRAHDHGSDDEDLRVG